MPAWKTRGKPWSISARPPAFPRTPHGPAWETRPTPGFFRGVFGVSNNGILVYRSGSINSDSTFVRLDRTGKEIGTFGEPAEHSSLQLSPDGTRMAVERYDDSSGSSDIWIYDLKREVATRFTFGRLGEAHPVWSPDGKKLAFTMATEVWPNIYTKAASGVSSEEL